MKRGTGISACARNSRRVPTKRLPQAARAASIAESAAGLAAESSNPNDFVEVAESAADEAARAAVRAAAASAALDEASAAITPAL